MNKPNTSEDGMLPLIPDAGVESLVHPQGPAP